MRDTRRYPRNLTDRETIDGPVGFILVRLASLIPDNGLMMVAAIVLLRSAAVPFPVPADLLVVMVGVEAQQTGAPLWPPWLLLSAATTVGAALLYAFSRWVGRVHGDILHYGRYVGLTEARISTAEAQLDARGARAVFSDASFPDSGRRSSRCAACSVSAGRRSCSPCSLAR